MTATSTMEMATSARGRASKPKSTRPVRDNIEAFAIAILFAVLLKPFLLEAYMIPTPSMQPTMMGCPPAGVHDRLIVDKLRYALFEPQRWDIAVFRYPIRQIQSYVKRIVGMPNDRFVIAGGNIVPVDNDNKEQAPIRKPPKVQRIQWKEIFPARMHLDAKARALDYFSTQPNQGWTETGNALSIAAERGRTVRLSYTDAGNGGLVDRIFDGYPTAVAKALKDDPGTMGAPFEGVADARVAFTLHASDAPESLAVEIDVTPRAKKALRFSLLVEGDKGRLVIRDGGAEAKASAPFAFPLGAGVAARIGFTHVDGVLIAERDDEQLAELACFPHLVLDELAIGEATVSIALRGGGQLRFADLVVERDIQYKRGTLPKGAPIVVPDGHYFMMGDNPEQSADAREWRAITLGADGDRLVDPGRNPKAATIVGNLRPKPLSEPVDADENPVVVQRLNAVAFTDLLGEVHVLRGKPSLDPPDKTYGRGADAGAHSGVWFEGEGGPWEPVIRRVHFVPRAHVLGRPVLNFWPTWPFGPQRIGLIR